MNSLFEPYLKGIEFLWFIHLLTSISELGIFPANEKKMYSSL